MGIVHHASYLVWLEVGRTDLLRQMGIPYTAFEAHGIHSPVVEIQARYRQPALYDDPILVETRLAEVGAATARFEYEIYREEAEGEARTLLVTAHSLHAFLDPRGRPVAIRKLPELLAQALTAAKQD